MALRDLLVHLLTEAAEIEHNLLCSYLYAAFSLKRGERDGLSAVEAEAVGRWRGTVVDVAIEEMGHLALVNNLLVALGGAPHFDRPNLPAPPGYHPAGFVIRLMPLNWATLDHFIFVERPADANVPEGGGKYAIRAPIQREMNPGQLTPSTPDYETIGQFYAEICRCLSEFANRGGRFVAPDRQLSLKEASLPGLRVVRTVEDAQAAINTIVEQGEGSSCGKANCHFSRFLAIRREWAELEAANPSFVPYLDAAHDPVMRRPAQGLERVWITEPRAARMLDLGNALYAVTLSILQQVYGTAFGQDIRAVLVKGAVALMHAVADVGAELASLPAQTGRTGNAGLTFAVPRNLHALPEGCLRLICERLTELQTAAEELSLCRVSDALGATAAKFATA
jgi:hypothetical protein